MLWFLKWFHQTESNFISFQYESLSTLDYGTSEYINFAVLEADHVEYLREQDDRFIEKPTAIQAQGWSLGKKSIVYLLF